MLFLIGAEEIGAVGIPEGSVMEVGARDGVAVGVDKARGVGQEKSIERNGPKDVGRLRHHHVSGIGRKSDGALAEGGGVVGGVGLLFHLGALGGGVVDCVL